MIIAGGASPSGASPVVPKSMTKPTRLLPSCAGSLPQSLSKDGEWRGGIVEELAGLIANRQPSTPHLAGAARRLGSRTSSQIRPSSTTRTGMTLLRQAPHPRLRPMPLPSPRRGPVKRPCVECAGELLVGAWGSLG